MRRRTERRFVEFRRDGDELSGVAMRNGDVARLGSVQERFEPRSLRWDDVILNIQHDRRQPVSRIGSGLTVADDGAAVSVRSQFPETR